MLMARGRPGGAAGGDRRVVLRCDRQRAGDRPARAREAARLAQALEALSALIEAAPFPMWHRGPDLRLALVNSAYVARGRGRQTPPTSSRAGSSWSRARRERAARRRRGARARAAGSRSRTVPATIGGERRTIRIVDVPLGEAGVAGYAIDVEELEQARAELGRFVRAQRDMLDRLSAGVAQFGARSQRWSSPTSRSRGCSRCKPEWLADRPEFDRVLERMREAGRAAREPRLPRLEGRAAALVHRGRERDRGELAAARRRATCASLAQPLPDGGLLLIFEDRTEQVQLACARDTLLRVRTATFDNLFEAVGVFAADGRLHLWNSRFRDVWGLTEEELARASARRCAGRGGRASGSPTRRAPG